MKNLNYEKNKQRTKERIENEGGKFIKFNNKKRTVHFLTFTKNKKVECIY